MFGLTGSVGICRSADHPPATVASSFVRQAGRAGVLAASLLATTAAPAAADWNDVLKGAKDAFGRTVEKNVERLLNGDETERPPQPIVEPEMAPPAPIQPPPPPAPPYTTTDVAETQRLLTLLGYDPGPVDGMFGSRTGEAIAAFQSAVGLPVTRLPSSALIADLRQHAADKRGGDPVTADRQSASPESGQFAEDRGSAAAPAIHRQAEVVPVRASAADAVPGGPGTSAEHFLAALPEPEGVRIGMALADAVERLTGRGYQVMAVSGCKLTWTGSGRERIEVTLGSENIVAPPVGGSDRRMPSHSCAIEEGHVVSRISYKQFPEQAARKVSPAPELERIQARFGAQRGCDREFLNCVWPEPDGDTRIEALTVTLSRGWGREAVLAADMLEVRPDLPERAGRVAAITAQAKSMCESYDGGYSVRRVSDCGCISENVGKAYARGQLDEVSIQMIDRYNVGCPARPEILGVHFYELCLKTFARKGDEESLRFWALNGGCICTGDKAAEAYTLAPTLHDLSIRAFVRQAAPSCDVETAKSGGTPDIPRTRSAETISTAHAAYSRLGPELDDIRPLEIWLKDGLPVLFADGFATLTVLDGTFDYDPQEAAMGRFADLLMLADDPALMEEEEAPRILAAENLTTEAMAGIFKQCRPADGRPYACQLDAADEFQTRALQAKIRSSYKDRLRTLAAEMPRGFIEVGPVKLGSYSGNGFPLEASSYAYLPRRFLVTADSLFGYSGNVFAHEESQFRPQMLHASPAEAEALLERLPVPSGGKPLARLAVTYDITDIRPPTAEERGKRIFTVVPRQARLYADASLTDLIAVLPLSPDGRSELHGIQDRTPEKAADETEQPASATSATDEDVAMAIPLDLPREEGRLIIDLSRTDPNSRKKLARLFNLILAGADPAMVNDPENAAIFADQNLIGMTEPTGDWEGTNKFQRTASRQAYEVAGARRILDPARALKMPLEIEIWRKLNLDAYDFDKAAFPIYMPKDAMGDMIGKPSLGTDHLLNTSTEMVGGALTVRWTEGKLSPKTWSVPPAEAQAAVEGLHVAPNGQRKIWYVSVARLLSAETAENSGTTFNADLLGTRLHAQDAEKTLMATIP